MREIVKDAREIERHEGERKTRGREKDLRVGRDGGKMREILGGKRPQGRNLNRNSEFAGRDKGGEGAPEV